MTPAAGKTLTIHWGDGNSTVVAAGDETTKSNVYAAAGTYSVTVTLATDIVQVDLHDSKLSGLQSAELAASAITYFICYSLGTAVACAIDSADMADHVLEEAAFDRKVHLQAVDVEQHRLRQRQGGVHAGRQSGLRHGLSLSRNPGARQVVSS